MDLAVAPGRRVDQAVDRLAVEPVLAFLVAFLTLGLELLGLGREFL